MRKYKVTLLVPHERTIEAASLQEAHKEGMRLTHMNNTNERAPKAVLHSIEEDKPAEVLDFGPSPAA